MFLANDSPPRVEFPICASSTRQSYLPFPLLQEMGNWQLHNCLSSQIYLNYLRQIICNSFLIIPSHSFQMSHKFILYHQFPYHASNPCFFHFSSSLLHLLPNSPFLFSSSLLFKSFVIKRMLYVGTPKLICWSPKAHVIVLGSGSFGSWSGLDESLRMEPHEESSVLIRRDT